MNDNNVIIDKNKCVGCGLCVKACAAHNLTLDDKKAKTIIKDCIKCAHCQAICPNGAITISGFNNEIRNNTNVRLNPNDVLDVIRFRRSIRHFKQKEIPTEIIEQILEAGRLTHTAKNMQDVSFIVLEKEKNKLEQIAVKFVRKIKPIADLLSPMSKINKIDDNFFFFDAPIVIVILAKDKTNGLLASQNMEFMAESYGLGVLYSGFFTMAANFLRKIKKSLKVPKGKKVAMTLVLGYPDIKFLRSAQRKEIDVKFM